MADEKERLSTTAAKGKRNLLFFAAIAWYLALGWIEPADGGHIVLAGFGAKTSMKVILWGLFGLLVYNLLSFLLHAPIALKLTARQKCWLLDPTNGPDTSAETLFDYLTQNIGSDALPAATSAEQLSNWLSLRLDGLGNRPWVRSNLDRVEALAKLWNVLDRKSRWRLTWRGLRFPGAARLAVLGNIWEMWVPLLFGLSGFVALVLAIMAQK